MAHTRLTRFGIVISGLALAAERPPFKVDSLQARPGESVSGMLEVPGSQLPVTIVHGAQPGPVLALVAGTHGYEYPPILALQKLRPQLDPAQTRGTLILVQLANMPSFLGRTVYFSPIDGKNLNRVFPGRKDGTVSERIAWTITTEVIERCDYLVDLHCGDGNESLRPYVYQPVTGRPELDSRTAEMALAWGLDHIVIDRGRPLDPAASVYCSATALARGKPAMTVEDGYLGTTDPASVERIQRGVLSLMRHLKMMAGVPDRIQNPVYLDPTEVLTSPVTGILYPEVERGSRVAQGALLASITDFFGRPLAEVRAPFAGVVLYVVATPPITKGQPVAFIGAPKPPAGNRAGAPARPRARDLGIPFDGTPGPMNAMTDVAAVEVGHTTLIRGEGALKPGQGPVRTGVTVILPRGKRSDDPVFAGWFSLNGNGEMTGTTWVEESGFLEGPVAITNTHSVGTVRDAIIAWQSRQGTLHQPWSLPVVAETYDGWLNDVNGFHVKPEHVFAALEKASGGPVEEGNVGGGTGMICYGFKGGIGTASRRAGGYTVGALVQANFGGRDQLLVAGAPVGKELDCEKWPCRATAPPPAPRDGSVIVVVATDAPLAAHQLKRLARRVSLGLARTGSTSGNGSGDIFIAFSTANAGAAKARETASLSMLSNPAMNPLFDATVQAVEEAVINALVAAETMTGRDGHRVIALPHEPLREVLQRYGRLTGHR